MLQSYLRRRNISIYRLAKETDISYSTLNYIVNGRTPIEKCSLETFKKIANLFPFVHAVDLERAVLAGNYSDIFLHFWWVFGYAIGVVVLAIGVFLQQMRRQ